MSGWATAKLSEVAELIARGVAPKYIESGGIGVVNQRCIRDHQVDYSVARRHDNDAKPVDPDRLIRAGDVLVNSTGVGTLGRVAQVRVDPVVPTTVDTHVTIVRPQQGRFFPDFFGYMLVSIEDQLARAGEGASGQTELSRSAICSKFDVRFPNSLDEQKRIVAILDEAFEGIAKATANAERNIANARGLFEVRLNAIFEAGRKQWPKHALGDLGCAKTGGTPSTRMEGASGRFIPFIKPGDFAPDGSLNYFNEGLSERGLEGSRLIEAESALMVCIGATIGKAGYTDRPIAANQQVNSLTPRSGIVGKFLHYQMRSDDFQRAVMARAAQATLPIINKSKWSSIPMWVPASPAVQADVVAHLDWLQRETGRLAAMYAQKGRQLAEFRQSLLYKAFSGQLTGKEGAAA